MIRIYDRQDRFKGDINMLQSDVLGWLIIDEMNRAREEKRQDYEVAALAANSSTNPVLLENLQKAEGPVEDEDIEWVTPQSEEDIHDMLAMLNELPPPA